MSFPLGCVVDANVDYLLRRHYFYPLSFVTHIATDSGSATAAPTTLSAGYANTEATMPALLQVAGTRHQAIQISTTAATLSAVWTPYDMDNRWPVYVRIHWTSNSALASIATFNAFWSAYAIDSTPATPSLPLTNTMVGVAKSTTPAARTATRWGAISPLSTGGFAFNTFPATADEIQFNFAVSSLSNGILASEFVWVEKVELAYTPRQTFGDGSGREARYMNQILSTGPQEGGPTFSVKAS